MERQRSEYPDVPSQEVSGKQTGMCRNVISSSSCGVSLVSQIKTAAQSTASYSRVMQRR
jgi:hypothetical protein